MRHSAFIRIPAAMREAGNALGVSMGWGPNSFSREVGDGETVTYYACHTDVSRQFIAWVRGEEPFPDPAAQPVVDALVASFSPDPADPEAPILWGLAHAEAVLAPLGLVLMGDADA